MLTVLSQLYLKVLYRTGFSKATMVNFGYLIRQNKEFSNWQILSDTKNLIPCLIFGEHEGLFIANVISIVCEKTVFIPLTCT